MGMGSQNKPHERNIQETKCKSLCNDIKKEKALNQWLDE